MNRLAHARTKTLSVVTLATLILTLGSAPAANAENDAPAEMSARAQSKGYALMGFRHDPCAVHTYRVRKKHLPRGALKDVRRAMKMVSKASGMKFKYAGKTKNVPLIFEDGVLRQYGDASILIGWVTAKEYPGIKWVAGAGGARYAGADANGFGLATEGHAAFNTDRRAGVKKGFGRGNTRGELILHEVGHALGLDHVKKRGQVMKPNFHLKRDKYGRGDLAGFKRVGAAAGCFPAAARQNPVAGSTRSGSRPGGLFRP